MARRWWVLALVIWVLLATGSGAAAREQVDAASDEGLAASGAAPASAELLEAIPGEDVEPLRVSMEFQDANLKDVLKAFSQQTGINVIASGEVADQPITLYLDQVAPLDALDQILRAGNLLYERPPGSDIYTVRPRGEVEAPTITRVYRIRYARVSKSLLARAAAALGARTPFEASIGAQTQGGGGGGTTPAFGVGLGGGAGSDEVGIDVVIKPLLTDAGDVVVDGRTNSLIITDVPANFPRLEAALAALDVRTPQILVDAEIVETTLSKLKDLGVEWGTGSEGTLFQLTPAKRTTRFPFNFWSAGEKQENVSTTLTVGTFDSSQAIAVLQALEIDTDTKILARPKILTLDNESAIIKLTTEEAIGFQTTTGEQTATTSSEPERTTTGVVLVVTPQVNEGGYITMLVEPAVSKTVASKISPPEKQSTPRDPKTRSSRTLVRIRNGDTLVVGGLIDRSEQKTLRRVPILSGIPFVGEAFKNTEIDDSASELIVFVTPRILEEPSDAQVAAAGRPTVGLREQEPPGARQDVIEQTLNVLEQPSM